MDEPRKEKRGGKRSTSPTRDLTLGSLRGILEEKKGREHFKLIQGESGVCPGG